ncbi:MAG: hypothetical protein ACRC7O_17285 [Fimbriiglobus sp.]
MITAPAPAAFDSVSDPRHPFGLPMGTVRGVLSLLICGFFWAVMLWPGGTEPPRPLLAHYFMLMLVILTFSPYSKGAVADPMSRFLPWLLRFLVVAGTAGVAVLALARLGDPVALQQRVTPDPTEVSLWWVPFLLTAAGGFAAGMFLRFVFGPTHPLFQTLRAWLSVIGMLLLVAELVFWMAIAGAENKPDIFVHTWQGFSLAFVAAYFGTRA